MTTITITGDFTLGMLLQLFRQRAGMDQVTMGRLVGASRPTISAWENDAREPSFSQVVEWARITEQPLDALVDAVNSKSAPADAGADSEDGAPEGTRTPNLLIGSPLDEEWAFWSLVDPLITRQGNPDTEIANAAGSAL